MLIHRRVPPSSMSPVPIYTPVWGKTKWSKVPCIRKQRNGRGSKPGPPDPEIQLLTARPHTLPIVRQTINEPNDVILYNLVPFSAQASATSIYRSPTVSTDWKNNGWRIFCKKVKKSIPHKCVIFCKLVNIAPARPTYLRHKISVTSFAFRS